MNNDTHSKKIYVVFTNTDLTEGRGYQYPMFVCESLSTAKRVCKKVYVMGSDGPIEEMDMQRINGQWFVPVDAVKILQPSAIDVAAQQKEDEFNAVIEKVRAAGLTEAEIALIQKS